MNVSTQSAVAEILEMTPAQLSDIKRAAEGKPKKSGSNQIPFKKILEWALSNDIDVKWLFTGERDTQSEKYWFEPLVPSLLELDETGRAELTGWVKGYLSAKAPSRATKSRTKKAG